MIRQYVVTVELPPLIVGDPDTPLFACPDCGSAVFDQRAHDQFHGRSAPVVHGVPCRCPSDPAAVPAGTYWHCSRHDRSSRPTGPVLRGDGGIVDRDQVRIWSEQ
jgi:hypothetical protein